MFSIKATSLRTSKIKSNLVPDTTLWTLAVIPDTQRLAPNNATAYNSMMQWLVDESGTEGIEMVIHLGDFANNGASNSEWNVVETAMDRLHTNSIPWIACAGNHDYDDDGQGTYSRKETKWNGKFPESQWNGKSYFIDSYNNITTNMAAKKTIGTTSFLFLTLEFQPRAAVLTWAQGIIDANVTDKIILATHTLTDPEALYATEDTNAGGTGQAGQPQYYGVCNFSTDGDCKTGQEIYSEFIVNNDNIILACSGHDVVGAGAPDDSQGVRGQSAFSKRVDTVGGNPVNVHLFNYQNVSANSYANSAYIRLYRITNSGSFTVETYNPVRDTNLTDGENQFSGTFN
tara:strand:+ start:584 stop:1615 length:1032 start_codon:yes stop_codon:yes gene_type:complete